MSIYDNLYKHLTNTPYYYRQGFRRARSKRVSEWFQFWKSCDPLLWSAVQVKPCDGPYLCSLKLQVSFHHKSFSKKHLQLRNVENFSEIELTKFSYFKSEHTYFIPKSIVSEVQLCITRTENTPKMCFCNFMSIHYRKICSALRNF